MQNGKGDVMKVAFFFLLALAATWALMAMDPAPMSAAEKGCLLGIAFAFPAGVLTGQATARH